MELSPALLISFLASLITASHALRPLLPLPINLLRPLRGSGGHPANGVSCESWRFAVETNNIRDWKTVPATCEQYVGNYMLGDRYREDSIAVTSEAIAYAESLKLKGDGNDVWVFDVDETVISNLPYYAQHGFGLVFKFTDFSTFLSIKSLSIVRSYLTSRIRTQIMPLVIRNGICL